MHVVHSSEGAIMLLSKSPVQSRQIGLVLSLTTAAAMTAAAIAAPAPKPLVLCLSKTGEEQLLPAYGRNTAPESSINLIPNAGQGGLSLSPLAHPGAFVEQAPLPEGAHDGAGFYHDGWLYMSGGQWNSSSLKQDLLAAAIGNDGNLTTWQRGAPFAMGVIDHSVRVQSDRAYMTGGYASVGETASQQPWSFEGFFGSGNVTSWITQPTFTPKRMGHDSVITNGFVYILGGDKGVGATDDVSVAAILPDGSLSPWRATTPIAGGPLQFLAAAATSRHVFVLGGCHKPCTVDKVENRVWVADILADGALGAWRSAGTIPVRSFDFPASVINGRIVISGGRPGGTGRCGDSGGDNSDDVWWADILADGTLGPWQEGSAEGAWLPRPRSDHASVVDAEGRLWLYGGRTSCRPDETRDHNNNYPTNVWRAKMVPETGLARLGSWLSGPMTPGSPVQQITVEGTGSLTIKYRTYEASGWQPWSASTTAKQVLLTTPADHIQALVEVEGDGTSSPVLKSVKLFCRP